MYQASQLVTVFYKQGDSLNLLQYKKLGVPGNQIQAFQQSGPLQFTGIMDQFFAAAFIPDGTDLVALALDAMAPLHRLRQSACQRTGRGNRSGRHVRGAR